MAKTGALGSSLATWLATVDETTLADVLAHRPDVLLGPQPRTLGELADRLQQGRSVLTALSALNVPALQAAEALVALGAEPTVDRLAGLLDPGPAGETGHRARVEQVLAELRRHALAWPHRDGLRLAAALRQAYPRPLALGRPARSLLSERTVAEIQRLQRALGLPRGASDKRSLVGQVAESLADGDFVRARAAALPQQARELLDQLARPTQSDVDPEFIVGTFDPKAYAAQKAAADAAVESGLLLRALWGRQTDLPAEVARALRGTTYRAAFTPQPPEPLLQQARAEAVRRESAASAGQFVEHATSVLDAVASSLLPCLRSGGVGAREIGRLAKAIQASDQMVRLVLELAGACGLLTVADGRAVTTAEYDGWREREPAERAAPLLAAWWELLDTPTVARDGDGKNLPALHSRAACELCRDARHALLDVAASLPAGRGIAPERASELAWWRRPALHLNTSEAGAPLAWQEAELLGAVALGALTDLGRALREGGAKALDAALRAALPAAAQSASFGSDLTVLVSGSPSAEISALLSSCADRESRGAAGVWRISPASVRRALDAGSTASELEARLAAIASGELPQPLRYLIADVGRRHGHLRVSESVSCICSPDEALLAELAGHRSLRKLGLRALAPTVLASGAGVTEVLTALRAAGYLPVTEGADGSVQVERAAPTRAARRSGARRPSPARAAMPAADPLVLARELLAASSNPPAPAQASTTELAVEEYAAALSAAEVRQLAHAIDQRLPILVEYESSTGGWTSRVLSELELLPPHLYGWCHLREDERMFTLSRLRSATAV